MLSRSTSFHLRFLLAQLGLVGLISACDGNGSGTPPRLSNLGASPMSLRVGQENTVTLRGDFADDEGNVLAVSIFAFSASYPGASSRATLENAIGKSSGNFQAVLRVSPTVAEIFYLRIRLIDTTGKTSGEETITLSAQ